MVDIIIKKLNEKLANKVAGNTPPAAETGQQSKFDQVLASKQNNGTTEVMEKLAQSIAGDDVNADPIKTIPASDLQINIQGGDFTAQSTTFDGKRTIANLFGTLNSDMVKMDSIIEVLSSQDAHLSRKQLLAYQASIGTLTINSELFSRLAQAVSQNLNTLLQTNVG